jgi:O-antigen/teichoic acid export membrane protein
MISKAAAISFPALIGFGAVAPLAVPTIFGDKWEQAGTLAQIFAFMAPAFTLNQFASPALGALGASRSLLVLSLTQLSLTAVFTILAAPYGVFAVAWAYVLRAYLTLPMQIIMLHRISGIGFNRTWSAIWQPFAASVVMGVVLHGAMMMTGIAGGHAWLRLIMVIGAGALIYGVVLLIISPFWRAFLFKTLRELR